MSARNFIGLCMLHILAFNGVYCSSLYDEGEFKQFTFGRGYKPSTPTEEQPTQEASSRNWKHSGSLGYYYEVDKKPSTEKKLAPLNKNQIDQYKTNTSQSSKSSETTKKKKPILE